MNRESRQIPLWQCCLLPHAVLPQYLDRLFNRQGLHALPAASHGGRRAQQRIVNRFFRRFDDPSDPMFGMRRLRPSLAWEFSREVTVPRRQEWAAAIIDAHCPGLSVVDRQRFSDLVVVLVSSSLGEAMVGYLGRSGAETADRVQWALEALLTQAVSSARTAGTSATSRRSRRVARWR